MSKFNVKVAENSVRKEEEFSPDGALVRLDLGHDLGNRSYYMFDIGGDMWHGNYLLFHPSGGRYSRTPIKLDIAARYTARGIADEISDAYGVRVLSVYPRTALSVEVTVDPFWSIMGATT